MDDSKEFSRPSRHVLPRSRRTSVAKDGLGDAETVRDQKPQRKVLIYKKTKKHEPHFHSIRFS
jgi:hypothetical protein